MTDDIEVAPAVAVRRRAEQIEALYPVDTDQQIAQGVGTFQIEVLETVGSETLPAREIPVVRSVDGSTPYVVTAFQRIQRAGTIATRGLARPFEVWFWGPDGKRWYGAKLAETSTLKARRLSL